MKTTLRLAAQGLLALAALPDPGRAQVEVWPLGKGGLTWASQAETQVGAVSVEGALQPLEITPGVNLTRLLVAAGQQWQNNPPDDYTLGGLPHTWTNANAFNGLAGPLKLVDGDSLTSDESFFKSSGNPAGTAFFFDLGAAFPINRVRFYPAAGDPDGYMRAYELFLSAGREFDRSRRPTYLSLRRVENNDEEVVEVDFATSNTRFIQLKNLSRAPFSLAEFEIYGGGFLPLSSYVSQLHTFGGPVNYGRLLLDATLLSHGEVEEEPKCVLQVRNGADDSPLIYYRSDRETGTETEVSLTEYETLPRLAFFRQDPLTGAVLEEVLRAAYLDLPVEEQGPIRDFVRGSIRTDGEHWSPWSAPMELDSTGTYEFPLDLPGPRTYLQFRVFFSGDAENTMRLDALRLEYSPQLATSAVGEVALASQPAPADGIVAVPSGADTTFTCDLRVAFDQDSLAGFSGVKLSSFPPPVFARLEMGSPPVPVSDPPRVETASDGFSVFFEPAMDSLNNQPIRLVFRQQVLEHNTAIDAWLLGPSDSLPQPVAAGNANDGVLTNTLTVYTTDPAPALQVKLAPAILTPNGDGLNDAARLSYSLIQFAGQIQLEVEVFDLAGRRVRQLFSAPQASGAYQLSWDGRGDGGQLLPPGNYLCRVKAQAQARTFTTEKIIGVVY